MGKKSQWRCVISRQKCPQFKGKCPHVPRAVRAVFSTSAWYLMHSTQDESCQVVNRIIFHLSSVLIKNKDLLINWIGISNCLLFLLASLDQNNLYCKINSCAFIWNVTTIWYQNQSNFRWLIISLFCTFKITNLHCRLTARQTMLPVLTTLFLFLSLWAFYISIRRFFPFWIWPIITHTKKILWMKYSEKLYLIA